MNTTTAELTLPVKLEETPSFEVVKELRPNVSREIEEAVKDFMTCSNMPQGVDPEGFYYQTLSAMANATYLNHGGDLWLGFIGSKLVIYILAVVNQDIDFKLTYWVSQGWVREDQRGKPWVKKAWDKVRQRAKDLMCKHLVVISSKPNDEVYCRFLGPGFHKYATLLKEEI